MKKPKSIRELIIKCNLSTFKTQEEQAYEAKMEYVGEQRKTIFGLGDVEGEII